jgi:signal transduction histidine kinase
VAHRRNLLLFLPLTPVVVVLVGMTAVLAVGLVGAAQLRSQSDAAAALRSEVLARALAARLRATALSDRAEVVERAASRSGAEILLVGFEGNVVVDGSLAAPPHDEIVTLLLEGEGEATTRLGRTRYHVAPLRAPMQHLSVVAFVPAPSAPHAMGALVRAVAIFAFLLIGAATAVALSLARDVHSDIATLQHRITQLARADAAPAGRPVPVRGIDEVGVLTSAFNVLVERFAKAERQYRSDLGRAMTYDRDRSVFLAALSHELRTPLNSILGFADVLLSEAEGPLSTEARENVEVIHSSGQHLRSLIDDILALSAIESGQLRLDRQETNLFGIAADVVREAKITAKNKPLAVQLAGRPTMVWADPLRVRQILGNIVGNAVKFTQQGSVLVFVEGGSDVATVTVTDTGPGIPTDQQAMIFEEYRQAGDAASRRKGSGLGLAITRRLVSMHGGSIDLESEIDVGSRFTIQLPRHPPEEGRISDDLMSETPSVVEVEE